MNYTLDGKEVTQNTIIVQGIGEKCILGADLIHKADILIDPQKQCAVVRGKGNYPVFSAESVSLSGAKGQVISLNVPAPDGHYLIQPVSEKITEGMIKVENGKARLEVFSTSMYETKIERNEYLGSYVYATEVHKPKFTNTQPGGKPVKGVITEENVNMADIPRDKVSAYLSLMNEFSDVFSLNPDEVGNCSVLPQEIKLKNPSKVTCTPPYRIPYHLQSVVEEYVTKLLKANIIENSKSPFSSPLMLVKKASARTDAPLVEQYRIVHDFRQLNDNTIKDSYPMHNLYDLLDKVSQAKVWSVIDLSSGFWNQQLSENSRKYTAFGVPGLGHFQYRRSAQGLCNSPAAFQRLLDYVTKGIPGVSVYIDDVIIFSDSHEEHRRTLQELFKRLRMYNIKCRLKKIQLGANKITYLGYDITRGKGIQAGLAKTEAVRGWKEPRTVKEIRQFLGLCSFFRRTIPNFADISAPLSHLTRKNAWKEGTLPLTASKSFQMLKDALCARPCLQPVDFKKEFIVSVDASKTGLGAILSQVNEKGEEHPCAYASRILTDAEKKYAPFHLEHLAMLWGCRHFKAYLVGRHFTLRTDHKPLTALNKTQGATLERLLAELEEFLPYTIVYQKGEQMPADGLSRLTETANSFRSLQVNPVELASSININYDQIKSLQMKDPLIKAVAIALKFNSMPHKHSLHNEVSSLLPHCKLNHNIIMFKDRVWCPSVLRNILLGMAHDDKLAGHYASHKTYERLANDWQWPDMKHDVEFYVKSCVICNRTNPLNKINRAPLSPLPMATNFNSRVHIDLLGPLRENQGYSYVMVCIDAFSKLVATAPLASKQKNDVALAFFNNWICKHGVPSTLVSDRGTEFTNDVFNELQQNFNISHVTTSSYHPQANGQIERQMRNLLQYFRKFLNNKSNDWVQLLPSFEFSYNTTIHSTHHHTPFSVAFARNPQLSTSIIRPVPVPYVGENEFSTRLSHMLDTRIDIIKAEQDAFETQKREFDKRTVAKVYKVGDRVYLTRPKQGTQFQKFQQPFQGPYVILKVFRHTVMLRDLSGLRKRPIFSHVNNIKPAAFLTQIYSLPQPSSQMPQEPEIKAPRATPQRPVFIDDEDDDDPPEPPPPPPSPPLNLPEVGPEEEESAPQNQHPVAQNTPSESPIRALIQRVLPPRITRRVTKAAGTVLDKTLLSKYPSERRRRK